MKPQIQQALSDIAQERNIRILYACESGSRAWGLGSEDSDYDVRFIYAHHQNWYLSIRDRKDGINMPMQGLLDIAGWEARKALNLFSKSNATPYEWLQSPIVYHEADNFRERLWELREHYFVPKATTYHYLGLAKNSHRSGVKDGHIKLKTYFYVLRPLLAASWIVDRQEVPPMEFGQLKVQLEDKPAIRAAVEDLVAKKHLSIEADVIPLVSEIEAFITAEFARCDLAAKEMPSKYHDGTERLDLFFRSFLG